MNDNSKPFGLEPDPLTFGEWLVIIGLTTMALGFFALAIIGVVGLVNVIAG